jgi:TonB family protein
MKFITYCWLLAALASTTALAQPHPKKKPIRKHAGVRRRTTRHVSRVVTDAPDYHYPGERSDCSQPKGNELLTFVKIPTLTEAGDTAEIVAAIQQRLRVAPAAPKGRVLVQFGVTEDGLVTQARVLKGLRADVDSAVVRATRQLPCFIPGMENGQPLAVGLRLYVPIVEQLP